MFIDFSFTSPVVREHTLKFQPSEISGDLCLIPEVVCLGQCPTGKAGAPSGCWCSIV